MKAVKLLFEARTCYPRNQGNGGGGLLSTGEQSNFNTLCGSTRMIRDCGQFMNFCETRVMLKRVIYNLGNLSGSKPEEREKEKKQKLAQPYQSHLEINPNFFISKSE